MFSQLKDKTVLVTGAGSGIGAALARRLGGIGAKVICSARTQTDIDDVIQSITQSGGTAMSVVSDATDKGQTDALRDVIDNAFGGLDIAYLNVGGNWQKSSIEDSDVDEWRLGMELNLLPLFLGVKLAAPLMRKKGGGRIIFTGSAMAHYAAPNNSSYCAGKAAARIVAQTAALELMNDNITVNEFIPGPVRSRQALDGYDKNDPNTPFNNPKEWIKEPDDVVDMMLMMAAYPGMGPTSQIFSLARR